MFRTIFYVTMHLLQKDKPLIRISERGRNMSKNFRWLLLLFAAVALLIGCVEPAQPVQDPSPGSIPEQQIVVVPTEEPLDQEKLDELHGILKRVTFLDGITVDGISIGGMTMEQAKEALSEHLQAAKQSFSVSVPDIAGTNAAAEPEATEPAAEPEATDPVAAEPETAESEDSDPEATETDVMQNSETGLMRFSGENVTVMDNLDAVLDEAFGLVREDKGYDAVMSEVAEIAKGKEYEIHLSFDEESLRRAVDTWADTQDTSPVDATVAYNKKSNSIDYTDDVVGRSIDREALVTALLAAENGSQVEATVIETPAEITSETVQNRFVLRGKKTTNFKGSTNNRKYNIRKGVGLISGTILHPGDEFSTNGTLGVRNKANGWKLAGAYNTGAVVQEYGGGVCQLSSTLYNAAVMADMEITFRQNHSMPVSYISKGLDATINSVGNLIDFKFKNSSKSDVIIIGYTEGNELTFEIYGIPLIEESDGEYDQVKISKPKSKGTIYPSGEIIEEIDYSKKPGYREKVQGRQNGSIWETNKEFYLNGELVKSEFLARSTYKAFAGKYIVGPPKTEDDSGNDSGSGSSGNNDSGNSGNNDSGNSGNNDSGSSGNNDSGNSGNNDSGNSGNNDSGNSGNNDSGNSGNNDSGSSGNNDSGNHDSGNSGNNDSGNSGNNGSDNSGGNSDSGNDGE